MEDSAETQDGDPSNSQDDTIHETIVIVPHGDVMLDVAFATSRETLRSVRKATRSGPAQRPEDVSKRPAPRARLRVAYRVEAAVLKTHSKYFSNLLGDTRFHEAKTVAAALKAMSLRNVKPAELDPDELPWIEIEDDDDASKAAGRESVFAELLRILHKKDTVKGARNPPTLAELATLAIMADRFACAGPVSAYVRSLRFKFPQAHLRQAREDGDCSQVFLNEEAVRRKILTCYLLDLPVKFHGGTRELIIHGSTRWSPYAEPDEAHSAMWWDLPDGLERELQTRRESILRCIASVQQHFLRSYTSRNRQCQLGYGSSSACDSFQLGEMVKFLAHKNLLYLVDFSPSSLESVPDCPIIDVYSLLATLRQCPSYQIDTHHTNCGLRTKVLPILDYIQTMLSSNAVGIALSAWRNNRAATSWAVDSDGRDEGDGELQGIFRFTRSLAGDQRLRYEGAMAAEKMAKRLFAAREWDWTPEF